MCYCVKVCAMAIIWVRIFHDGGKLLDSARLVSEAVSGSSASG